MMFIMILKSISQINNWKKFKWLASTERAREYLMAIPDEKMKDQDWFDLRATDF